MFKYLSIFYNEPASLIDYLPEDGVVILDEISRIQETASHLETEEAEWYISLLGEGTIIQDLSFSHSFEEFLHHKKKFCIFNVILTSYSTYTSAKHCECDM